MELDDLTLTVALAFIVGIIGAVSESVLLREPKSLWSAQFYLWLGRSSSALWWRDYWKNRGPMERREQVLVSFMMFFHAGIVCAIVYFLAREAQ